MWVAYAFGSALFAGMTSVLAKVGIKNTDSNLATALRTVIVLLFSWVMVFIVGSQHAIAAISPHSLLFLVLSGGATGASWLCYFKALQLGDVNKVVPIDKSSTVLTLILAFIFLGEKITIFKGFGIAAIGIGTILMINKKKTDKDDINTDKKTKNMWLVYAVFSAVFASLTAIFGKIGITGIDSNLGTAIRTIVVLIMAWIMVFVTKKQNTIKSIDKKELLFISLSGITTGASWLFYYKALHDGLASVVVPIDKLSILITIAFSYIVFKEKLSIKAIIGLVLIVAGTLLMLV